MIILIIMDIVYLIIIPQDSYYLMTMKLLIFLSIHILLYFIYLH